MLPEIKRHLGPVATNQVCQPGKIVVGGLVHTAQPATDGHGLVHTEFTGQHDPADVDLSHHLPQPGGKVRSMFPHA